jgi:hypothetical protein
MVPSLAQPSRGVVGRRHQPAVAVLPKRRASGQQAGRRTVRRVQDRQAGPRDARQLSRILPRRGRRDIRQPEGAQTDAQTQQQLLKISGVSRYLPSLDDAADDAAESRAGETAWRRVIVVRLPCRMDSPAAGDWQASKRQPHGPLRPKALARKAVETRLEQAWLVPAAALRVVPAVARQWTNGRGVALTYHGMAWLDVPRRGVPPLGSRRRRPSSGCTPSTETAWRERRECQQ